MTRINTNVSSLTAQNRLQRTNNDLQTALTRLSTGLRINSGKDDPAGLIASEALRSDITSINKAISNTQRASQIIATADSALGQVSNLLNDIRGLVTEAANKGALSDDEIAANQLQIDSSLDAINRIAQTTTFQGRKLLDGSLDFITQAGTGFSTVSDLKINQANLGATGNVSLNVDITSAATKATISSSGIAASTASAASTGTITFGTSGPVVDAVLDVALSNAYTVGDEASGTVSLANAFVPNNEASVTNFTLADSGIQLDIDAVDGELADGEKGNDTIIEVVTGASTGASYDEDTNILTLTIVAGTTTAANLVTAINAEGNFSATVATAGTATANDIGVTTGAFAGGSDTVAAGTFDLQAVNGGAADGITGNTTSIEFTSGVTTGAAYNAQTNRVTVTVASGATISDIANAINSDLSGDFVAANVTNGNYRYSSDDNGVSAATLTGGTDSAATPAGFRLQATSGGDAAGTKGNNTQIVFAAGLTTGATYDSDANILNVTVAAGATINQVASAIDTEGTFQLVPGQTLNGTALFSRDDATDDFGTNTPTVVTEGTELDGVITVQAKNRSSAFDKSISFIQSNAIAAGTAVASINSGTGNIEIRIRNSGSVSLSTIRNAINELDDYEATLAAGNGDGSYDIVNDDAPTIVNLTVVAKVVDWPKTRSSV